jgi:hypothetical protein
LEWYAIATVASSYLGITDEQISSINCQWLKHEMPEDVRSALLDQSRAFIALEHRRPGKRLLLGTLQVPEFLQVNSKLTAALLDILGPSDNPSGNSVQFYVSQKNLTISVGRLS